MFRHSKSISIILLLLAVPHLLLSAQDSGSRKPYLDLTFAGDIMSHSVNTNRTEFFSVFSDIRCITDTDDLTFANFESPVIDTMENKSYPMFNSRSLWPETAAACGIDVFCLANNHTNDQYQQGIADTWTFFDSLMAKGDIAAYSGIQPPEGISGAPGVITMQTDCGPLSFCRIEKSGWTILFLAETEMLNDYYRMSRINYVPRTRKNLKAFPEVLQKIRSEYPCDLFILGVHTDEPEYVFTVTPQRRSYFDSLLKAGVDIIWANHPHVTQEWDILTDEKGRAEKLIMYSVGNLISGQRTLYGFDDPAGTYEWIGDSVIMEVSAVDTPDGIRFDGIFPVYATTHRNGPGDYVIKRYTQDFIAAQEKQYKIYYTRRLACLKTVPANIRKTDEL